jgi:tetratricopeptide (TPR) repeat protein
MRMYRPLEMMSLWLDQQLWWRNGFGFHLTQVALHALNGVLVLQLASALGAGLWPSVAAAAIFVAHPVQVESVAWITCRADVLTGTFAVAATLVLLRHQRRPAWWTIIAAAVFGFLCTGAKETGAVTPLLLFATVWALPEPPTAFAQRLRRAAPVLGAALVGIAVCMLLRPSDVTTGIGREAFGSHDLWNLLGAFGYQCARVLFPVGFAPFVPRTPTDFPHLALALAGAAALTAAIVSPTRDGALRRLGALWFVIAVAPAVAVVLADFSATPVAERRLYLGMVGVALLVASALQTRTLAMYARSATVAVGTILAVFIATTITRNGYWRNELSLWTAVTDRVETEPLPYLNLGLALADAGRKSDAEAAYHRALALRPDETTRQRVQINLGLLFVDRGAFDDAQRSFDDALAIGPHGIAYRGRALIARKRAQMAAASGDRATASAELTRAKADLDRALAINPRYYQARYTLGGVLYDAGQYRAALAEYRRVIETAPDTDAGREAAEAAEQLGAWLAKHPEAP